MIDRVITDYIKEGDSHDNMREIVKKLLKGENKQQVQLFAWRNALRTAWRLEKLVIKDKTRLDEFYFYYCRSLYACRCVVVADFPRKFAANAAAADPIYNAYFGAAAAHSAAAYAAAANATNAANAAANAIAYTAYTANAAANAIAYTATATDFTNQLNSDLSLLKQGEQLDNKPLWLEEKRNPSKLDCLEEFWQTHLFQPALDGALFKPELNDFDRAFMAIPNEILEIKSAQKMAEFIQGELRRTNQETNQARMILLGNGGAGKTSLVNALLNPTEELKTDEACTPRISVTEKTYGETQLDIWDFGGQVIMHSSHIVFISAKSLYVIVCNQRANEQPDAWLEMLIPRIDPNDDNKVLVVYSHCDQGANTAWRRDNAIKRKYAEFSFEFFDIDFKGVPKDIVNFVDLEKAIENKALEQGKKPVTTETLATKKIITKTINNYITYKELKKEQEDISIRDLKAVRNYGYCFPENPDFDENIADDFKFIKQRHWFTYGIYSLINNKDVLTAKGILTDETIGVALELGEVRYIDESGALYDEEVENSIKIVYQEEDIALFRKILLNYNFAMSYHKRHDEILLPLATPLDEPETIDFIENETNKYLEIRFKILPSDLFFKLASLVEKHLDSADDLWRTGVVLHYFLAGTKALVKVENHTLSVSTNGEHEVVFLQLLSHYIKAILLKYNLEYNALERILIDEKTNKYELVDSKLLDLILNNNENLLNKLTAYNREKTMIINNTFNAPVGGVQQGDGNTMTNNIGNCLAEVEELIKTNESEELLELKGLLQQAKETQSNIFTLHRIKVKLQLLSNIYSSLLPFVPLFLS